MLRNIFSYRTVTFCPDWTMLPPPKFPTLITAHMRYVCVTYRLIVCLTCVYRDTTSQAAVSPGNHILIKKPKLHHDISSACCLCSKQGAGSESKVTVALICCQLLFLLCCWRNVCKSLFLPYKAPTEFSKMWKTNKVSE